MYRSTRLAAAPGADVVFPAELYARLLAAMGLAPDAAPEDVVAAAEASSVNVPVEPAAARAAARRLGLSQREADLCAARRIDPAAYAAKRAAIRARSATVRP